MTVTWDDRDVLARIRKGALQGVLVGAQAVHETGTQKIQDPPKTGKVYRRRGVTHQASAPGQPPASDTGRLVGSGDVFLDPENISARVNWGVGHALPLELGTEKMEPRPFARPSLAENVEVIRQAVADGVTAALK